MSQADKASVEERQKIYAEVAAGFDKFKEKSKAFKEQIETRIRGVLTKEQIAKHEKILAEWPAKLETLKAQQKNAKKPDDSWKKSWKPGDPVPKGAVPPQQRKPFPMM